MTTKGFISAGSFSGEESNLLGYSCKISGDGSTLVVGIPDGNDLSGSVNIYKKENGNWTLKQTLVGTYTDSWGVLSQTQKNSFNEFGSSVGISRDGSIIAVGEPTLYSNAGGYFSLSGRINVYEEQSGEWVKLGSYLTTSHNHHIARNVQVSADGSTIAFDDFNTRVYGGGRYFAVNKVGFLRRGESGFSAFDQWYSPIFLESSQYIDINDGSESSGEALSLSDDGSIIAVDFISGSTRNIGVYRLTFAEDNSSISYEKVGSNIATQYSLDVDSVGNTTKKGTIKTSLSSDGSIIAISETDYHLQKGIVKVFQKQYHQNQRN